MMRLFATQRPLLPRIRTYVKTGSDILPSLLRSSLFLNLVLFSYVALHVREAAICTAH